MTVKLHAAAAQLLAALALIGCSGGGPDVPTPDEAARADYARIAGAANIVLFGDVLGYRAGSAEPVRVPAACNDRSCSIGFGRPFGSGSFSVDTVKLEILPDRNGVREVVERKVSDTVEVTVFGGWMKHGFFGSQVNRDQGREESEPWRDRSLFLCHRLRRGEEPRRSRGHGELAGLRGRTGRRRGRQSRVGREGRRRGLGPPGAGGPAGRRRIHRPRQ